MVRSRRSRYFLSVSSRTTQCASSTTTASCATSTAARRRRSCATSAERFAVAPSAAPVRARQRAATFGMYLGGGWYRLAARAGADARGRPGGPPADVSLLARPPDRRPSSASPTRAPTSASTSSAASAACAELERRVDSGEMAVGVRALSHADGGPDGRGRRRPGHAAQVHLVRAEAGGWAGVPRAGLARSTSPSR